MAIDAKQKLPHPAAVMLSGMFALVVYMAAVVSWFLGPSGHWNTTVGGIFGAGGVCLVIVVATATSAAVDNRRLRIMYYLHTGRQP